MRGLMDHHPYPSSVHASWLQNPYTAYRDCCHRRVHHCSDVDDVDDDDDDDDDWSCW